MNTKSSIFTRANASCENTAFGVYSVKQNSSNILCITVIKVIFSKVKYRINLQMTDNLGQDLIKGTFRVQT